MVEIFVYFVSIVQHHTKIKTTKLFYCNTINMTILSCTNINWAVYTKICTNKNYPLYGIFACSGNTVHTQQVYPPFQIQVVIEPVHEYELVSHGHLLLCQRLVRVQPRGVQAYLVLLGDLSARKKLIVHNLY